MVDLLRNHAADTVVEYNAEFGTNTVAVEAVVEAIVEAKEEKEEAAPSAPKFFSEEDLTDMEAKMSPEEVAKMTKLS